MPYEIVKEGLPVLINADFEYIIGRATIKIDEDEYMAAMQLELVRADAEMLAELMKDNVVALTFIYIPKEGR